MAKSLSTVQKYIRDLGWSGPLPDKLGEARDLLAQLQMNRPPSDRQLNYLKNLGFEGDPPDSMYEASLLISHYLGEQPTAKPQSVHPSTKASSSDKPATKEQVAELKYLLKVLGLKITLKDSCGRFASVNDCPDYQAAEMISQLRREAKKRGIEVPAQSTGCLILFLVCTTLIFGTSFLIRYV